MVLRLLVLRFFISVCFILSTVSFAWTEVIEKEQPQLPETLSLNDVLFLASKQNLNVLSSAEEIKFAKGKITEAYAAALPQLGAEADMLYVSDSISRGDNEQTEVSLTFAQPLFRSGAVKAGLKAAKFYNEYASATLEDTRLEIVNQAAAGYYDVLLTKADLDVSEEAVKLSAYDLEMVTGSKTLGTATNLEVSRAKERLSSNQADKIESENRVAIAKMRLLNILGLPVSTPVQITGDLNFSPLMTDLNEDIKTAENRRPDLKGLELQAAMQRENIIAIKAGRGLSLDLVGGYTQVKPESPIDNGFEEEYYGGIMASIPIFEGGGTRGKTRQEKARLRQAEVEIRRKKDEILLGIHEAYANIQTAERMVKAREDNLNQAEEALELARKGYELGVNLQLDVLDAQLSYTDSHRQYLRAIHNHNIQKINFERVKGTLLDNIGPETPALGQKADHQGAIK